MKREAVRKEGKEYLNQVTMHDTLDLRMLRSYELHDLGKELNRLAAHGYELKREIQGRKRRKGAKGTRTEKPSSRTNWDSLDTNTQQRRHCG